MTFPLIVLALGAIFAGFFGIPAALGGGNAIEHFLEPSFTASESHAAHGAASRAERGANAAAARGARSTRRSTPRAASSSA